MVALLCGWSAFLYISYTQTVASGWDPLAYKVAGERLAAGQGFSYCHPHNAQIGPYFTLSGFNLQVGDDACLYLNYPIGFPLLLATAQRLVGSPSAAWYVPAVSATVELLAVFAIGTALFGRWAGLFSALVLAFTPTHLTFGTSLWSDLPGVAALTGGLAFYLWAERTAVAWLRWMWAVVAGALVILGLFTRYANWMMLLSWVVYVLLSQKRAAFKSVPNWVFGIVVTVGIAGILLFNRRYYGGFLSTPYNPKHGWYPWPAFSLRYILGESPAGGYSLLAVIRTVWGDFSWLLLLVGWGITHMRAPQRALMLASVLTFIAFYASYAFPAQGINARFLLPVFPYLSLAAGHGLWNAVPRRLFWWWRGLGIILIMIVLLIPLPGRLRSLMDRNKNTASYVQSIVQLVEDSEPEAVFLAYNANDVIAYYGQRVTLFYRRIPPFDPTNATYLWDELEPRLVEAVNILLEHGEPVYYVRDSDPPFADSLSMLDRHFILSLEEEKGLPVYRIRESAVK
jgi:hypothetical protein